MTISTGVKPTLVQHEIRASALAAVIRDVVLDETDRAAHVLNDDALDAWAPSAEVLGRDLVVALWPTVPALVAIGIGEETAKRSGILRRGRSK